MYLLVDGYNLYYTGIRRPGKNLNLEKVREEVLSIVRRYCRIKGYRAIIFWDGGAEGGNLPRLEVREGIEVRFSPPTSDADTEIKRFIDQYPNRAELRLISSDRDVQQVAEAHGVAWTRVRAFLREVDSALAQRETAPRGEPHEKYGGTPPPDEIAYWLREFGMRERDEV